MICQCWPFAVGINYSPTIIVRLKDQICEVWECSTPGPSTKAQGCQDALGTVPSVGTALPWLVSRIMEAERTWERPNRWDVFSKDMATTPKIGWRARCIAMRMAPICMDRSCQRI